MVNWSSSKIELQIKCKEGNELEIKVVQKQSRQEWKGGRNWNPEKAGYTGNERWLLDKVLHRPEKNYPQNVGPPTHYHITAQFITSLCLHNIAKNCNTL